MDNTQEEGSVESVTMTDILNLSSWDRPRTSEELVSFITRHEAELVSVQTE